MRSIELLMDAFVGDINKNDIIYLLNVSGKEKEELYYYANEKKKKYFGKKILVRGVIEISNICKNNSICFCRNFQAGRLAPFYQ